jgi:hypothetical protein
MNEEQASYLIEELATMNVTLEKIAATLFNLSERGLTVYTPK